MNSKIVFVATFPLRLIVILLIYFYKYCISPIIPHTCRFTPSCSTYMLKAIREWGVCRGFWLGVKRICRCRPGGMSGEDFVPLNIKGDLKWIY